MARAPTFDRGAWGWALYEWARNPYVVVCGIYVMAPYISSVVAGDPIAGQAMISGWHKISGFIVAVSAPFVGAATDAMGRRKPFLAAMTLTLAAAIFAQWWALPEGGLPLAWLGAVVVTASISFVWTEVLHNSMLPAAAPEGGLSRLSGLGLALGNASSVLLLVFVLWAFALPGVLNLPFLPEAPLFGLDPTAYEPSRVVAPLCAAWLVMFSFPIFVFTPDLKSSGMRFGHALASGVMRIVRTLRKLRDYRNIALFLIARMLYADGKTAILIFSGVYAAGVMGWELVEMLTFGVVLSVFAVIGGLFAGVLDTAVGPKRAVVIEIVVTTLCLATMVSVSPTTILFTVPIEPGVRVWDSPLFATAPELIYLCAAIVIAISITAAYGSSRSLMARLSPPNMAGEFFGLYALSGSATAWLGPMLVESFTEIYHSQRAGFGAIAILLVLGFLLLLFVKPPAKQP